MQTLLLVTLMFFLTASCSLLWLTVRAFKTTPGWGLSVLLFSPVSATIFGVKYWEKQREPFLLFISTFTATFALSIYLLTVAGGAGLLQLTYNLYNGINPYISGETVQAGAMHTSFSVGTAEADKNMLRRELKRESGNTTEKSGVAKNETRVDVTPDIETKQAGKKKRPPRYRLTYVPVKITDARKYIGTTAKIKRKNVEEKEYVITGASPKHIELAQRSRHGNYSFHFKNSDIERVRVLINEAY